MKIHIPAKGEAVITLEVPAEGLRALYAAEVQQGHPYEIVYREFVRRIIGRARESLAASSRAINLRPHELNEEMRAAVPEITTDQVPIHGENTPAGS